ncbi:MAG: tRNA (adenosine(37)-N6)-dimethylallyltransferase MiaA, partial [Oscillospiraceae bacterium]|nr:tRNA (adenosine(37)-N6)-dimethylallyltransferase MiaA [Oscillospiraceae bacterium]
IVIVGPTASGKTALSIELAKEFNGEIISADSMQIYKGMSVATAKPTIEEMQGIKHYLIDFLEPETDFSVADYVKLAREAIDEIAKKGKIPIIVGGTGLYISSLIDNVKFDDTCSNTEIRDELYAIAKEKGNNYLWNELLKIDPETAGKVHENNLSRVVRAIEVFRETGIPISQHKINSRAEESPYEPVMIGITFKDRNKLYERIEKRVDLMAENGMLEEAREIYSNHKLATAHQAIGYKELIPYFENKATWEECLDKIKLETRHYAKRQLTWFRRDERINWYEIDEFVNSEKILEKVKNYVAKTKIICYNIE